MVFRSVEKQAVARGRGKHLYSYCTFAQERRKEPSKCLCLSSSELPFCLLGRSSPVAPARSKGGVSGSPSITDEPRPYGGQNNVPPKMYTSSSPEPGTMSPYTSRDVTGVIQCRM